VFAYGSRDFAFAIAPSVENKRAFGLRVIQTRRIAPPRELGRLLEAKRTYLRHVRAKGLWVHGLVLCIIQKEKPRRRTGAL